MNTLLINGKKVEVPGRRIIPPRHEPWIKLVRGSHRSNPVTQAIIHKTIAHDAEHVLEGAGNPARYGGAQDTVEYWQKRRHKLTGRPHPASGTQLVGGRDGTIVQTEDLVAFVGFHAHTANDRSFGVEIKETAGGYVYRATLEATLDVVLAGCSSLGIQWQAPAKYVEGRPLRRFMDGRGGADLTGIFGHRNTTGERGYHDPGDEWFRMARARGVEAFDFERGQDLDVWALRQEWLSRQGVYAGAIDGIPGPKTRAGLLALGYPDGIFARHRELAERPPMPKL